MAESGELIVKSYLKNVKKCEIVEINWNLPIEYKEDIIQNQNVKSLIEKVKNNFKGINLKNNEGNIIEFDNSDMFKNLNNEDFINKRLLNQVEIDVVGYSKKKGYILNEVAIHTGILNYGSSGETVEKVKRKILRLLIILMGYFNGKNGKKGEINFFSIKSATTEKQVKIDNFVKAINLTLEEMKNTNVKVKIIKDRDFCDIYEEIEESVSSRSTNEFERFLNINKTIKKNESKK